MNAWHKKKSAGSFVPKFINYIYMSVIIIMCVRNDSYEPS